MYLFTKCIERITGISMYKIDFNRPIHIHFIGIGGISMSGLAEILLDRGFTVSGSDVAHSPLCDRLAQKGVRIFYSQISANISDDIDCVVYTAAVSRSNEELIEAVARKIPTLTRAELLGQLMKNYPHAIAVSGTHGKTTTTSMISHILLEGDMDPTISVGGILDAIGGNIRVGSSDTFITEACEYTNSFLHFFPKIAIILNIEEDHLDFFKDLEDIRESFRRFSALLPEDGTLIINGDINNYTEIYEGLPCRVVTYGFSPELDYCAKDIAFDEKGLVSFSLYKHGTFIRRIRLGVVGKHNVSNALSAIACADLLGVSDTLTDSGLLAFRGTKRRFELKGSVNGATVIDDYAHHPTEIEATLEAASHFPHNKLWCVFQPHTYTRTKAFLGEFAQSLQKADHLLLADIYAARETDTLGISSGMLAEKAASLGADALYLPTLEEIADYLRSHAQPGDLIMTLGAGDVVKVADMLTV